ncbi:hypothetical protein H2198_010461 [Neophaeococcomyces mojaviensis]|uniref:Uncharacterized protein n=1 Tax=Neophaeococcomyces mojaviensis TaxID=3383035 RepID=A0ACC2ZRV8_9EURO|nr:hypothetical protein H2198_010461 [Knufia sp. JES_112]
MAREAKPPFIMEPEDQSKGRPATFVFLHGYGDDAEGLPMGLAQQFQFYHKLPYLRWVLPNAPHHPEAATTAWYMPKALPSAIKPRVPGQAEEDESAPDDEDGILKSCDALDGYIRAEIDRGVPGDRIVVGGFSQGCAISLVWGLIGKERNNIAGVLSLSGYLPLANRIAALREERGIEESDKGTRPWFLAHGSRDALVPLRLFAHEKEELVKWVDEKDIEGHLYDGMAHSTSNAELRDMLAFLSRVVPP